MRALQTILRALGFILSATSSHESSLNQKRPEPRSPVRILCGITTNKGWWSELERRRSAKEAESTGLQDSLLVVEKTGNKYFFQVPGLGVRGGRHHLLEKRLEEEAAWAVPRMDVVDGTWSVWVI